MDEFSFIKSIQQNTYRQSTVIKGMGDDAAVFRQPSQDIVTAIDTFVEGVHFNRNTMGPFHVGYRALAANLSDLAAMGAAPAFYLVSITIPSTWLKEDLEQIYAGMKQIATQHGMDLIGGDTVSGSEFAISITVIGYVEKGMARYRSHAEIDDIVFVTGTLGDAQAGFHLLVNPSICIHAGSDHYLNKHRMPFPRIAFALELAKVNRVALNDISDGIANEAAEIAEASQITINIDENKLPVSPTFGQFPRELQRKWKLFGGEDFELLGAVSAGEWTNVQKAAKKTQTPITKIGYTSYNKTDTGAVFLHGYDQVTKLERLGFTHLK